MTICVCLLMSHMVDPSSAGKSPRGTAALSSNLLGLGPSQASAVPDCAPLCWGGSHFHDILHTFRCSLRFIRSTQITLCFSIFKNVFLILIKVKESLMNSCSPTPWTEI